LTKCHGYLQRDRSIKGMVKTPPSTALSLTVRSGSELAGHYLVAPTCECSDIRQFEIENGSR